MRTWREQVEHDYAGSREPWSVDVQKDGKVAYCRVTAGGAQGGTRTVALVPCRVMKLGDADKLEPDPGDVVMQTDGRLIGMAPALLLQAADTLDAIDAVWAGAPNIPERVQGLINDLHRVVMPFVREAPELHPPEPVSPEAEMIEHALSQEEPDAPPPMG